MRTSAKSLNQLQERIGALETALSTAQQENALLRQKIDLLVRRLFGSSSERLDAGQLQLGLSATAPVVEVSSPSAPPANAPAQQKAPARAHTVRLPDNLPVVEEVIEPQSVREQPDQWRRIGQEVSEQLDYEPGRFLRRRTIRPKYVHRFEPERAPVIAALPERLAERSLPAAGLLAHILVSKYCDHLPLYRQEQIFARRHQVHLPRQTLARWVEMAAEWLKPIYENIRTGVMAGGYVQVDETPVRYLEPGHGSTRQGYFWTVHRPRADVLYHWQTSRAAACLEKVFPSEFRGIVQCDGYAAYGAFAASRREVQLAGCWAHARRKFHDAREQAPRTTGWFLRQIQHLYQVEADLRTYRQGPAGRLAVRGAHSRMIVERLKKALVLLKASGRHLPQSLLGQAIDYTLGQWSFLEVYLGDGRLENDNNLVENSIRPTAVGKKNWLFIGEAEAGQRSAIIYTIVESCRRRGLEPLTYLREVFTRLPTLTNHQIPQITPEAYAQASKDRQSSKHSSV
jgi:transposase